VCDFAVARAFRGLRLRKDTQVWSGECRVHSIGPRGVVRM
jgi:hypothetical protein